ncbi:MAG: Wzt carbohydrate-binding domain-containing protein [Acidobacteriota bacterium]
MLCNKPSQNMLVKEDGSVYLCCYLAEPHLCLGNLNVHTLDEIWNSEPARLLRLEMTEGLLPRACRHCPYYAQSASEETALREPKRWGGGEATIERVAVADAGGVERAAFERGETLSIRLECAAAKPVQEPVVGIAVYHASGRRVFGTNTALDGRDLAHLDGRGVATICFSSESLSPGRYLIDLAIHSPAQYHYDYLQCLHGFDIVASSGASDEHARAPAPSVSWRFDGGFRLIEAAAEAKP